MEPRKPPTEQLLARLAAVRRRIRWLLALEAVGKILVDGVAYAAVVAAADWWVHFPGYVRLIFNSTFVIIIIRYAWQRVYRPATAPIHLDQVALVLPDLPSELRDRLAASVAYLDHGGTGSSTLWHRVIEQTSDSLGGARLARGLRPARARRWMTAGVLGLVALGSIAMWQSALARVGFARLAIPLGESAWPRRVEILPLTGDAVVAAGESFEVAMRVARGESRLHRVYLNLHPIHGRVQREVLRRGPDGVYRRTLDAIRSDVKYSFTCGDHDLSDSPFTLRCTARPELVALSADVSLPTYVGSSQAETQSGRDDGFHAIRGGSLLLRATCHLPTADQLAGAIVALVFDDGRRLEMQRGQGAEWTARMEALESVSFAVELRDGLGLTPHERRVTRLTVRPDQPPAVRIASPIGLLDVTPRAELDVIVHAEDDVELAGVSLVATVERAASESQPSKWAVDVLKEGINLKSDRDADGFADSRSVATGAAAPSAPEKAMERLYRWSLAGMNLKPGDTVVYHVEARDAFMQQDSPRVVRTLPQRLNALSPAELARRLREELLLTQRPLRRLVADLTSIEGRTRAMESAGATSQSAQPQDRHPARLLAAELQRVRQSAGPILDRMSTVIDRGYVNRLGHEDVIQLSRRLHGELTEVSEEMLVRAVEALEPLKGNEESLRMAAAVDYEGRAIAGIHAILDRLANWNDYEELVQRVREMQVRQEALIRVVADADRSAQDARIDTLGGSGTEAPGRSAGAPREMEAAAQDQRQLSAEATRVLVSMKDYGRESEVVANARAAALRAAADLGYRHNIVGRMDDAVTELVAGRAGLAGDAQAGAAAGLQAMIAMLEEAPQRELSLLSRALSDAAERLKKIISAQRDLIARAQAADQDGSRLATRQSTLARTTSAFSSGLKVADTDAEVVQEQTAKSSEEMLTAAERLTASDRIQAGERQNAALELLEAALSILERRRQEADQAAAEKSLAALTGLLVAIYREQGLILTDTQTLASRGAESEQLSRAEVLRAGQLAVRQSASKEQMAEAKEKMSGSIVFSHVAARITLGMEESGALLDTREWGGAVVVQEQVLAELKQLIGAIEELPRPDPSKQFADAAGAGQSAAQPTMQRLIPPLAELKVLRSMQSAIHDQTVRHAATASATGEDAARRTELLRSMGASQRELHELATKLIEQAAADGGSP